MTLQIKTDRVLSVTKLFRSMSQIGTYMAKAALKCLDSLKKELFDPYEYDIDVVHFDIGNNCSHI